MASEYPPLDGYSCLETLGITTTSLDDLVQCVESEQGEFLLHEIGVETFRFNFLMSRESSAFVEDVYFTLFHGDANFSALGSKFKEFDLGGLSPLNGNRSKSRPGNRFSPDPGALWPATLCPEGQGLLQKGGLR